MFHVAVFLYGPLKSNPHILTQFRNSHNTNIACFSLLTLGNFYKFVTFSSNQHWHWPVNFSLQGPDFYSLQPIKRNKRLWSDISKGEKKKFGQYDTMQKKEINKKNIISHIVCEKCILFKSFSEHFSLDSKIWI